MAGGRRAVWSKLLSVRRIKTGTAGLSRTRYPPDLNRGNIRGISSIRGMDAINRLTSHSPWPAGNVNCDSEKYADWAGLEDRPVSVSELHPSYPGTYIFGSMCFMENAWYFSEAWASTLSPTFMAPSSMVDLSTCRRFSLPDISCTT